MSEDDQEDLTGGDNQPSPTRCGFVAIVGAPNAGKSTLTNHLVGAKISIVTHKVQTTRACIRGIVIEDETQIILVDTPGIFAPRRRLDRGMVDAAWGGAKDADLTVLLIDAARGIDDATRKVLEGSASLRSPVLLALNKVDMLKKEQLLAIAQEVGAFEHIEEVFMISALTGSGVEDLKAALVKRLPYGPWLYPEDQIADAPMRFSAAEITREKLFLRLHQELPYASTVETNEWKQLKDGSVRIEQTIYVERQSQKKIVLGANGQTVKKISMEARKEISEMVDTPVHLFLFVKVRENWSDDPERYREMGLDFPQS